MTRRSLVRMQTERQRTTTRRAMIVTKKQRRTSCKRG